MVLGGVGQVRIKGDTRWRRRDVSNKRPGVPTLAIWDGDILGYSHTEQYLGGEYINKCLLSLALPAKKIICSQQILPSLKGNQITLQPCLKETLQPGGGIFFLYPKVQ